MNAGEERNTPEIDSLVEAVMSSRKYRAFHEPMVRRIAARELCARQPMKQTIKETRNRIHQVAGAYLDVQMAYPVWMASLKKLGGDDLCAWSLEVMAHHASTRERLPELDEFYRKTLGEAPIASVLDLACGLNPLATPWMPLAPGCMYLALDICRDMAELLCAWFERISISGRAEMSDLIDWSSEEEFDVALAMKIVPTLEQQEAGAGISLLRRLRAKRILVSFPTRTLGGRNVRMTDHYDRWFTEAAEREGWELERTLFASELCFIVRKIAG